MNRLQAYFAARRRKTLIPYVSAGDPSPALTVPLLQALVAGGADILELGIPFSDPTADGPIIQQAHERALAAGMTLEGVLAQVAEFRRQNDQTPLVLMGYLNSLERFGFGRACAAMHRAGVDGLILVDCPVEALPDYEAELKAAALAPILLVAPTTSPARRAAIAARAEGFIYFVSLRGVTGTRAADAASIAEEVAALRALTPLPVCIGFGIRDGASAAQMATLADGVIIGSALVARLREAAQRQEDVAAVATAFMQDIRNHLDS